MQGSPERVIAILRDALPAGSVLVLSHATGDFAACSTAQAVYDRAATPLTLRSRAEIERFFDGFELVEPGLVQVPLWRPDTPPTAETAGVGIYGAVARRTG